LPVDALSGKMAEQIDKYGDKLFADPIEVDTPSGKSIIYPHVPTIFLSSSSGHPTQTIAKNRNNSCTGSSNYAFRYPLIKNLDNPKYMDILLDERQS